MALNFDPDASRRLLDALEAFRQPQGEGLRSEARGPVPREAAEAFRALLAEGPDAADPARLTPNAPPAGEAVSDGPAAAAGVQDRAAAEGLGLQPVSVAENPSAAGGSDLAADAPAGAPERLATPEELLRTQFSLNMQAWEAKSLYSSRDNAAAQADQILKSSG